VRLRIIVALSILLLIIGLGLTVYQLSRLYQANAAWIERAESDYYRGVLSSCVGIGMQMSMPQEIVATTYQAYWLAAYRNDWYTELDIDSWEFPGWLASWSTY
jgi:hypothetical protein